MEGAFSRYRVVTFLLLFMTMTSVGWAKDTCLDEELLEAQKSYRNCIESAKVGIVQRHSAETDTSVVCQALEQMLSGCDAEVTELVRCMNQSHVHNLQLIHLRSIADVIQALNPNISVEQCSVLTHLSHESGAVEQHHDDDHHQRQDSVAYPEDHLQHGLSSPGLSYGHTSSLDNNAAGLVGLEGPLIVACCIFWHLISNLCLAQHT